MRRRREGWDLGLHADPNEGPHVSQAHPGMQRAARSAIPSRRPHLREPGPALAAGAPSKCLSTCSWSSCASLKVLAHSGQSSAMLEL